MAYFGQWASDNNAVQYLLIIIDVFSRQLHVSPLKNKTGKDIVDAFSKLTTLPETLRTDGGSEFTNKLFQSFLKNNSIRHYIARNDSKAALAERVIQTLKRKIYQQMVFKNTPEYISTLSDIVNSYNKTKHANMGYAPNSVTDDNAHEVRLSRYLRTKKKRTPKFKFNVGDKVRVSYTRKPFDRVYDIHFSGEIFTVIHRKKTYPTYQSISWPIWLEI